MSSKPDRVDALDRIAIAHTSIEGISNLLDFSLSQAEVDGTVAPTHHIVGACLQAIAHFSREIGKACSDLSVADLKAK